MVNRILSQEEIEEKLNELMLSNRSKTLKINVRTWDSLKSLKKENETFDDVIKGLLNERTKSLEKGNVKAIKYVRKRAFYGGDDIGIEFEYNDVKGNKEDFILDLKIKKVFYGKRVFQPSEFFGVDNAHKHYSDLFLKIYLKAISLAIRNEFRISYLYNFLRIREDYYNLPILKKFYYDCNLSEESFKEDIEEPLRLSEEEKIPSEWKKSINNSIAAEVMRK